MLRNTLPFGGGDEMGANMFMLIFISCWKRSKLVINGKKKDSVEKKSFKEP